MITLRTTLRTQGRRPLFQWRGWLGIGLGLMILGLGGLGAWRLLHPATPPALVAGQTLAWEIAQTLQRAPGVQFAGGAYLPGDTLLLYSRINEQDRALARVWAQTQLEPFASRLAAMGKNETLHWVIDFGATMPEQEVISAPLSRAADATLYRYISAVPSLFTTTVASSVVASVTLVDKATALPNAAPTVAPGTVPTAQPALTNGGNMLVLAQGAIHPFTFDNATDVNTDWLPLSGAWRADHGVYSQQDKTGYDYISFLNLAPQTDYQLQVNLRFVDGEMGGGFIYNAPRTDSRSHAQSVDFVQQGSFLRWGHYDENGEYSYDGGVQINPSLKDGQWHTLTLLTHAANSSIALDGRVLGAIHNLSTAGYVGLITSKAQVDFAQMSITRLAPTDGVGANIVAGVLPLAPSLPATITLPSNTKTFTDTFNEGNTHRWRVLNGTWQFVDQSYQQLSLTGSDLGSISTFQGETYTVSVRLRRIDGNMGAGLYFNMAQRDSKLRSQMINYTQNGKVMQWGHFDDDGNFVFDGSTPVPDGNDGKWHTLVASVQDGKAAFRLDGKQLAQNVTLTYPKGYVGLLVSTSHVAFDDVNIVTP